MGAGGGRTAIWRCGVIRCGWGAMSWLGAHTWFTRVTSWPFETAEAGVKVVEVGAAG